MPSLKDIKNRIQSALSRQKKVGILIASISLLLPVVAFAEGMKSETELAERYRHYFDAKDINGILSLYALDGVEKDRIEYIQHFTSSHFGQEIKDIKFDPIRNNKEGFDADYSFMKSGNKTDKPVRMIPTAVVLEQMTVTFPKSAWKDGADGMMSSTGFPVETYINRFITMVGRRNDHYYLVAFRPQETH